MNPMNPCLVRIWYLLILIALAGVCMLSSGISVLPESTQSSINSQTGHVYTAQEQKENYNKLLLNSLGFKLVVLGSILTVGSLATIGIGYVFRRTWYSQVLVHPQPFVVHVAELVPQPVALSAALPATLPATESVPLATDGSAAKAATETVGMPTAESGPISPLMKHLPSTTHEPLPRVVPKHPETWNELRLEHLQGHTSAV